MLHEGEARQDFALVQMQYFNDAPNAGFSRIYRYFTVQRVVVINGVRTTHSLKVRS
jgi:hypothetical protein